MDARKPGTPPAGYSLLGVDCDTDEPVLITQAARRQGVYLIGANGTGKTGLDENLIVQDSIQGLGMAVIDPHGDLTNDVLARLPEKRLADVILLDIANEDTPFGLNLFTCNNPQSTLAVQQIVDQVMHIFERLFALNRGETPLLLDYLRHCTYLLVANPGFTMADIPLLFTNKQYRQKLLANVKDPDVRLFWQQYDALKPNEQREESASTLRRIREFLQPLTRNMVGQHTTIDLRQIMDERKILLVKLDARLPSVTSLIGSVLIALLLNAAYSRSDLEQKRRKQFALYVDEFQRFATEDMALLLTEARKFGIATTIGHQTLSQISQINKAAALQAATLVVFRVSGEDAQELAPQFERTPPPPSVDWIDEQTGEKPVKTFVYQVVDHLLKHVHADHRVMALVKTWLRPLDTYGQVNGRHVSVPVRSMEQTPALSTLPLALNDWLYQGMSDRRHLWQKLPGDTLYWLASFMSFLPDSPFSGSECVYKTIYLTPSMFVPRGYLSPLEWMTRQRLAARTEGTIFETTVGIAHALIDFLAHAFPAHATAYTCAWDGLHTVKGIHLEATSDLRGFWQRMYAALNQIDNAVRAYARSHSHLDMGEYERCYTTALAPLGIEVFLPVALMFGFDTAPYVNLCIGEKGTDRKQVYAYILRRLHRYLKLFYRYQQFRAVLLLAQLGLNQTPIMTMDSGRYEPDSRRHPIITQRTYPEMASKIANTLANLPNFEALVKSATNTGIVAHRLHTLAPEYSVRREELVERQQRIRANNLQAGYVRLKEEVEAEIRQRQESGSGTPPPAERFKPIRDV